MQYVEVNDLKMCCRIQGSGYPLVLIMGFTANMDWWDPELIESLSSKFTVLTFDNRGAGRTITPETGDFSCSMFADDTASLMNILGINKAHIFGFSMGGIIAQDLSIMHPRQVDRLVLGSTFCGGKQTVMPAPDVLKILMDSSGGVEEMYNRTLKLIFTPEFVETNPGFIKDFRKRYMESPASARNTKRQFIASMRADTYDHLDGIRSHTLVVTGARDLFIPPRNSHILTERIPGAKLIEYPDAGHCFMSQKRVEFTKDIIDFLG